MAERAKNIYSKMGPTTVQKGSLGRLLQIPTPSSRAITHCTQHTAIPRERRGSHNFSISNFFLYQHASHLSFLSNELYLTIE
jgi:hypothetical protein